MYLRARVSVCLVFSFCVSGYVPVHAGSSVYIAASQGLLMTAIITGRAVWQLRAEEGEREKEREREGERGVCLGV